MSAIEELFDAAVTMPDDAAPESPEELERDMNVFARVILAGLLRDRKWVDAPETPSSTLLDSVVSYMRRGLSGILHPVLGQVYPANSISGLANGRQQEAAARLGAGFFLYAFSSYSAVRWDCACLWARTVAAGDLAGDPNDPFPHHAGYQTLLAERRLCIADSVRRFVDKGALLGLTNEQPHPASAEGCVVMARIEDRLMRLARERQTQAAPIKDWAQAVYGGLA